MVVHVCPSCNFFYYVFGCALHTENVVIIPLPNKRFSFALVDNIFFPFLSWRICWQELRLLPLRGFVRNSVVFRDNREFKKITTETATAMSPNERFNEQKKWLCTSAINLCKFLFVLGKTTTWNIQTLRCLENFNDNGLFFKFLLLISRWVPYSVSSKKQTKLF